MRRSTPNTESEDDYINLANEHTARVVRGYGKGLIHPMRSQVMETDSASEVFYSPELRGDSWFVSRAMALTFAAPLLATASGSGADTRVCRVCKKTFRVSENSPTECRYHPARWMGAENSKHHGGAPAGAGTKYDGGVSYFWDCELRPIYLIPFNK